MSEKSEGFIPPEEKVGKTDLSKIPGLKETLAGWTSSYGDERGPEPLSKEQVIQLIASDKSVREAVVSYFSPGGEGYDLDPEVANNKKEELAWGLVEELENRLREK